MGNVYNIMQENNRTAKATALVVRQLIEDWISDLKMNRTGVPTSQSEVTMIWSVAVSIFCVGGMIGGSLVGWVADSMGRKGGLLLNNILVLLTVIFEGSAKAAKSYEMIIIGRFLIGINAGLNAGLAPMYLAEISPVHLRGAVGTVYQLVITISILVSQILGLEHVLGTAEQWPLLLCLTIVPALFQMCTLPFCPESPKYLLLSRGKDMDAQRGTKKYKAIATITVRVFVLSWFLSSSSSAVLVAWHNRGPRRDGGDANGIRVDEAHTKSHRARAVCKSGTSYTIVHLHHDHVCPAAVRYQCRHVLLDKNLYDGTAR